VASCRQALTELCRPAFFPSPHPLPRNARTRRVSGDAAPEFFPSAEVLPAVLTAPFSKEVIFLAGSSFTEVRFRRSSDVSSLLPLACLRPQPSFCLRFSLFGGFAIVAGQFIPDLVHAPLVFFYLYRSFIWASLRERSLSRSQRRVFPSSSFSFWHVSLLRFSYVYPSPYPRGAYPPGPESSRFYSHLGSYLQ